MTATTIQDQFITAQLPRQFVVKHPDYHHFIALKAILRDTLGIEVSYKEEEKLDKGQYVATFTITNWN